MSTEPEGLREALIDALAAVRARGEASALSGQHVHWTDADVADLILAEPALRAALATQSRGLDDWTRLAEAWANVMDGRRVPVRSPSLGDLTGRIGRDTTTADDWHAIAAEYDRLAPTQAPETEGRETIDQRAARMQRERQSRYLSGEPASAFAAARKRESDHPEGER